MIATPPTEDSTPYHRLLQIKTGRTPYLCENIARLPGRPLLLQRAIVETPNDALLWLVRRACFIADLLEDDEARGMLVDHVCDGAFQAQALAAVASSERLVLEVADPDAVIELTVQPADRLDDRQTGSGATAVDPVRRSRSAS
ncbi:hypothetical protein FE633_12935 [Streptomyces montanus]|uniref:Uncharacterized protein n=1 Tax=Streptomyces montanus TaxID=2580423 RepID=A0A5R9FP17_9ACTN|nr:hypothetical protein [Streptomyces montanus]TLS45672.1 hypothetical protein FE633_12935 [Streptomyces montanus]